MPCTIMAINIIALGIDHCHLFVCIIMCMIQIAVQRRTTGTPSYNSGLWFNDRIPMYAIASHDAIECNHLVRQKAVRTILMDLKRAHSSKKHVILLIQRSELSFQRTSF